MVWKHFPCVGLKKWNTKQYVFKMQVDNRHLWLLEDFYFVLRCTFLCWTLHFQEPEK